MFLAIIGLLVIFSFFLGYLAGGGGSRRKLVFVTSTSELQEDGAMAKNRKNDNTSLLGMAGAIDDDVWKIIESMTLEQKVGQLAQVM